MTVLCTSDLTVVFGQMKPWEDPPGELTDTLTRGLEGSLISGTGSEQSIAAFTALGTIDRDKT